MTYFMKYNITIGEYKVNTLKSVSVKKSVEQLSDTAVITLPGTLINQPLEVNDKIKVGDPVRIELGYEDYMNEEFTGYVKRINTDDTEIRIECEDELFLWDVGVKDKQYGSKTAPVSLKTILQELVKQVNPKYKVECDYSFNYQAFTFSKATALDVLRKIQDETKADIYFKGTTLHVHPLYGNGSWSGRTVKYDFAVNVVSANLQYKKASDQKLKVEIEYKTPKGETKKESIGVDGGKIIKKVINTSDVGSLQKVAESEYNLWCYDGYEGDLTGWLIPFCQPTDKVEIIDKSKQYKNGTYYVIATDVSFSESGGRRKVTIGRKV